MKSFEDFMRECYLNSTPFVDLSEVSADKPINPSDYKLKESKFEELASQLIEALKDKYSKEDVRMGVCMWALNKGPQLIE